MKKKRNKAKTIHFDISINGKLFPVQATPYQVNNGDTKFRVSYDGSPVVIFAWDNNRSRVVKIDGAQLPSMIESEILNKLGDRMVA